mmetsp:Transcript_2101/g.4007  ORF Transcript_2101/g.4007 Transcript_2101/m.4007 type:complete len:719 (+) Transcript_2101:364-2520(+)
MASADDAAAAEAGLAATAASVAAAVNLSSTPQKPPRLGISAAGDDGLGAGKEREERLDVRVDQPIENVEFVAHTLLRSVDGAVLTPSSRKIQFRWTRSKSRRGCAFDECPTQRPNSLFQSVLTGKRYCTARCLEADWRLSSKKERYVKPTMLMDGQAADGTRAMVCAVGPFVEEDAWEEVGFSKMYLPMGRDVGHLLRVECSAVNPDGSISVQITKETNPVIGLSSSNARLLKRSLWMAPLIRKSSIPEFLKTQGGGAVVRVMSYNVLAELYATKQLYPYCPLWALNWGYRRQLIVKELEKHNADVICLQEMQADHFQTYVKPQMSSRGYECLFKAKTREAMGRKGKIDGVAILYKKDRLRLIELREVEYNTIAINQAKAGHFQSIELSHAENEKRTSKILKRLCKDNVGLIALLETIPEGFADDPVKLAAARQTGPQQLCVATTHMFWDPEFADVKYVQTFALLEELGRIVRSEMPLILTGDFNSTPDSAVVEYLAKDNVDAQHPDFATDPWNLLEDCATNHNLQLGSAYQLVTGTEPHTTNYTAHFKGVLDYIWLSTNSVTPLAVLAVPEEAQLRGDDDTFMPNSGFPSDHVSLCVDININPRERVQSRPVTPSPPSPSLTPPLGMGGSPGYEHLHQYRYQQQHHLPHHRAMANQASKAMHSPNPAMLSNAYHHQQQEPGRHSPGHHPLSHQALLQQQQQHQQHPHQHVHAPRWYS